MATMFIEDALYEPEDKKAFLDAISAFLDAHPIELPAAELHELERLKEMDIAMKFPGIVDLGENEVKEKEIEFNSDDFANLNLEEKKEPAAEETKKEAAESSDSDGDGPATGS